VSFPFSISYLPPPTQELFEAAVTPSLRATLPDFYKARVPFPSVRICNTTVN
jgi:hypothetical protein